MQWRSHTRPLRVAVALTAVLFVAAACGDDAGPEDSVVFGSGSMPSTFPRDFPVPANAVIGSTLVDRVNHRSEVNMNVPVDLVSAVQFFQVGLVNQGYVVDRSEGGGTEWSIEFLRGELRGDIEFTHGAGLTVIIVTLNVA